MIKLDSIKESEVLPPRVLIYGTHGIGKTSFAAAAPSPVFIRTEDGLGVLKVPSFPLAESFDDVIEAITALIREDHSYSTVVIDSCDWLEILVRQIVQRSYTLAERSYGKEFLLMTEYWQRVFKGLDILRSKKEMNIILICHEEVKSFQCPEFGSYDRYRLKLQERSSEKIQEWVDVVGFASYKVNVIEGESKKFTRAVGVGERVLHLNESPAFLAKNRYGIKETLSLDWQELENKIKGN